MARTDRYRSLQERIIANTVLSEDSGYNGTRCWLWTGAYCRSGRNGLYYGKLTVRIKKGKNKGKPKTWLAHRLSIQVFKKRKMSVRQVSMHLCNVSICCNPDHLSGGTQKKNIQQCVKEGRHVSGFTVHNGNRKK